MDFTNILTLFGGISLFLFGMTVMGDALEKSAGSQLKGLLAKMTSNPLKGFILGAAVTAIIQSSSATTVMLVGFVNSGLMTLSAVIPVIMGANVGTTITAWILSLMGVDGGESFIMTMLKPTSFTPILAVIGVVLYVFLKDSKRKDIGLILLGFSVLIYGMDIMTGAVEPLAENEAFKSLLLMFDNPLLGVLAGAVITAIIQSSSASVGILQALSATGTVTFGSAIPIIMGQNIGTCVTAMISSVGANKNARRVAMVHLYFNIVGTVMLLSIFYITHGIVHFEFLGNAIDEKYIAIVHTAFNIGCTSLLLPCHKLLERLAILTIKDKKNTEEKVSLFDDRLLTTPSVALDRCRNVAVTMAETSVASLMKSLTLFDNYDKKIFEEIDKEEDKVDIYEDEIGSYLVKLTKCDLSERDSLEVTKLLHIIGDLERISDHAVNLAESAQEIHDKKISFSAQAQNELSVMIGAVREILNASLSSFTQNSLGFAATVEPLEEVVDNLKDQIKLNHIKRLQNNECTIELGFILSDLLTNLERISDHCSNIAGCVIEIAHSSLGMHGYTKALRRGNEIYDEHYKEYSQKYSLKTE